MSQILTLDLNDRVFTAIQQQAQSIGIAPELLAANLLEQKFAVFTGLLTNTEQQAKRAKFERHFGEIDLGLATNLDNESIDADLAKEYAHILHQYRETSINRNQNVRKRAQNNIDENSEHHSPMCPSSTLHTDGIDA